MENVVLGKKVSKSVARLQELYETKGPGSNEFAKYLRPFVIYNLSKKCHNFPEELIQYTFNRIYERITPKLDTDGKMRCFYASPVNGKRKPGYDPSQTNLGSYLISVITWSCRLFMYHENKQSSQLAYNEELENYDKLCTYEHVGDMNLKVLDFDGDVTLPSIQKLNAWLQTSRVN